jgi:hypothetical protein
MLSLSLALALLPACAQGVQPRAGIGGIGGFTATCQVTFRAAPDEPEDFEATYVFPDRARWSLSLPGAAGGPRQIWSRLGRRAWTRDPGAPRARELAGEDRDTAILQMELRRAAYLWPDGLEWGAAEGGTRRAPVLRCAAAGEARVGELVAALDAAGKPLRIEARGTDGASQEALSIHAWTEVQGRAWPQRLTLQQGDDAVWEEELVRVETRVGFGDLFFLPPEERPAGGGSALGEKRVLSMDLNGFTFRACELEGDSWDAWTACAEARAAEEQERLAPLGLALDPVPTFELGPDGKPTRIWLRLALRQARPPEGWNNTPDRPGLALLVEDPTRLDRELLAVLERAAPEDARGGKPYARRVGARLQVYLPLEAAPVPR